MGGATGIIGVEQKLVLKFETRLTSRIGVSMKSKIVSVLSTVLIAVGISVSPVMATTPATAAPVQVCTYTAADDNTVISKTCETKTQQLNRWGYCTVSVNANYITFFDLQGYCGSRVQMSKPSAGQCRYMGQWDNWAGSLKSNVNATVYAYDSSTCTNYVLPVGSGQDIADLYPSGFYNAITSISLS